MEQAAGWMVRDIGGCRSAWWINQTKSGHCLQLQALHRGNESIMFYTRFSAGSRSSRTKNLAHPTPLLATYTFAIRTSRSLRYLVTPKLVLTHTNYGKACFTQSIFELHVLSEVPGTPKMVLSHIKYVKAGCDRDITPRLGVCDRDFWHVTWLLPRQCPIRAWAERVVISRSIPPRRDLISRSQPALPYLMWLSTIFGVPGTSESAWSSNSDCVKPACHNWCE